MTVDERRERRAEQARFVAAAAADWGWRLADRATARNHSRTRRADLASNASADSRRDGRARRAAEWWSVEVE